MIAARPLPGARSPPAGKSPVGTLSRSLASIIRATAETKALPTMLPDSSTALSARALQAPPSSTS